MIDPHGHLAYLHAVETQKQADAHRRALARLAARPSLLRRVYARVWWASRPRPALDHPQLARSAHTLRHV